jgi:hypothetical protein
MAKFMDKDNNTNKDNKCDYIYHRISLNIVLFAHLM